MDWFSDLLARLSGMFHNSRIMRSGFLSVLTVIAVLAAAGGVYYEHIQGNFHKIRYIPAIREKATGARPGNMDMVQLLRTPMVSMINPEFISATVAPGSGMEVMQATITVPGIGDVPLLGNTGNGVNNELTDASEGSPISVMVAPGVGKQWEDAVNVVLHRQAVRVSSTPTPDGMSSEALFTSALSGNAASGMETTISTTLGSHSLDVLVTTKNVSKEPHAVSLNWKPSIVLGPGGMTLIPPRTANTRGESMPGGVVLAGQAMKATYTNLSRGFRVDGTELQLRNERGGYILHLIAASPTVRTLRIDAAKGSSTVAVTMSTADGETGDKEQTVLQPGENLHMAVRLQVTGMTSHSR